MGISKIAGYKLRYCPYVNTLLTRTSSCIILLENLLFEYVPNSQQRGI
jgi:hypothetical protein